MISVETIDGKILKDQRGLYLYGDDWMITPTPDLPLRYSFQQMLSYWLACERFGSYVLRIKAKPQ